MSHVYLSTACHHALHDRCRRECKFCQNPCACPCHRDSEDYRFHLVGDAVYIEEPSLWEVLADEADATNAYREEPTDA